MNKIQKGEVLVAPLPATNQHKGMYIEGSRLHPQNKGVVEMVGEADEFGKPIWEVGDIVLIPATGIITFDHTDGRTMKVVHHRRIPFGYEAEH